MKHAVHVGKTVNRIAWISPRQLAPRSAPLAAAQSVEPVSRLANRFPKCGFYSFRSAKTHAVAVVCPFLARVPCWLGIL